MFKIIKDLDYRIIYKEYSRPLIGAFISDAYI
jgi:hypothetical protein